jgi:HD superfamily phosphohydrolase
LAHTAVETLRIKGHAISAEEELGVCAAVLLHDIGHGPFSHALEKVLIKGVHHEKLSEIFMSALNEEFGGSLSMAIDIFRNTHPKRFLHQMVSSQLDMDRLDYLNRDSFFCGVSEGIISSERIIKMLDMTDDKLVIESKGIYSVENFIFARRLMYWQVYLHKTVIAAENMLINILLRARELSGLGNNLPGTPDFLFFLQHTFSASEFAENPELLKRFSSLDDYDVFASIKMWMSHADPVLARLCTNFVNRNLCKTLIQITPFSPEQENEFRTRAIKTLGITASESAYFVFSGELENKAYNPSGDKINILFKDGRVEEIAEASDYLNSALLSKQVKKYFLCY